MLYYSQEQQKTYCFGLTLKNVTNMILNKDKVTKDYDNVIFYEVQT